MEVTRWRRRRAGGRAGGRACLRHVAGVDGERAGDGVDRRPVVVRRAAASHLERVAVVVLLEHREEAGVLVRGDAERRRLARLGARRVVVHPEVRRVRLAQPLALGEVVARQPEAEREDLGEPLGERRARVKVGVHRRPEGGEPRRRRELVEAVEVGVRRVAVGEAPVARRRHAEVERLLPVALLLRQLVVEEAARVAGVAADRRLLRRRQREEGAHLRLPPRRHARVDAVVHHLEESPLLARRRDLGGDRRVAPGEVYDRRLEACRRSRRGGVRAAQSECAQRAQSGQRHRANAARDSDRSQSRSGCCSPGTQRGLLHPHEPICNSSLVFSRPTTHPWAALRPSPRRPRRRRRRRCPRSLSPRCSKR